MTGAIAAAIEAWPLAAREAGIFGHSPNTWRVIVTEEGRESAAAEAMLLELRSLIDEPVEHVALHTAQRLVEATVRTPGGVLVLSVQARFSPEDWRAIDLRRALVSCAPARRCSSSPHPTYRPWFRRHQTSGVGLVVKYGIFNSRLNTLMADAQDDQRQRRLHELRAGLQRRLLDSRPSFGGVTVDDVWRSIKRCLLEALGDDCLEATQHEIHQGVPKPTQVDGKFKITGGLVDGNKPFKRLPELARLKRPDGAWLHFTLTLQCDKNKRVEALWAYDFELVFPDGHSPAFVRFDLNEPDHPNAAREVRSHMHPASDDLQLPAPVMTPEELLDVLLRRLKNQRDPEHPRS